MLTLTLATTGTVLKDIGQVYLAKHAVDDKAY